MNRELGKLILKQIDAFPESFDMCTWGQPAECGTIACLGGHALLLSGYRLNASSEYPGYCTYTRPDGTMAGNIPAEAQHVLQMTDSERFDESAIRPMDIFLDVSGGEQRFRELLEDA